VEVDPGDGLRINVHHVDLSFLASVDHKTTSLRFTVSHFHFWSAGYGLVLQEDE
jgi:hypothetical protein